MPAQWSKKRWGPDRVLTQPVAVPAPLVRLLASLPC